MELAPTPQRLRDLEGQAAALTTLLVQLDRRRARLPPADRQREMLTLLIAEVVDALRVATAEMMTAYARSGEPTGRKSSLPLTARRGR
jgi:hypothetical protein